MPLDVLHLQMIVWYITCRGPTYRCLQPLSESTKDEHEDVYDLSREGRSRRRRRSDPLSRHSGLVTCATALIAVRLTSAAATHVIPAATSATETDSRASKAWTAVGPMKAALIAACASAASEQTPRAASPIPTSCESGMPKRLVSGLINVVASLVDLSRPSSEALFPCQRRTVRCVSQVLHQCHVYDHAESWSEFVGMKCFLTIPGLLAIPRYSRGKSVTRSPCSRKPLRWRASSLATSIVRHGQSCIYSPQPSVYSFGCLLKIHFQDPFPIWHKRHSHCSVIG